MVAKRSYRRGAALLEVVVTIGLLVFSLAVVGLQINTGIEAARHCDLYTRAALLVDYQFAKLQAGIIVPDNYDEELKGDFGIRVAGYDSVPYPGFTWRAEVEPSDVEELYVVKLQIGYNAEQAKEQIDDPALEIDIEDDGTRIVRTAYRLLPTPPTVDLERDFGLGEEEMAAFLEAFAAAGEASGEGGPEGLEGLDPDLASVIQDLLAYSEDGMSFDPRMLSQLPEEEFLKLAGMLETMLSPGDYQALQEALNPQGRGRGGRGRGGPRGGEPGEGGRPSALERAGRDTGDRIGRTRDGGSALDRAGRGGGRDGARGGRGGPNAGRNERSNAGGNAGSNEERRGGPRGGR